MSPSYLTKCNSIIMIESYNLYTKTSTLVPKNIMTCILGFENLIPVRQVASWWRCWHRWAEQGEPSHFGGLKMKVQQFHNLFVKKTYSSCKQYILYYNSSITKTVWSKTFSHCVLKNLTSFQFQPKQINKRVHQRLGTWFTTKRSKAINQLDICRGGP